MASVKRRVQVEAVEESLKERVQRLIVAHFTKNKAMNAAKAESDKARKELFGVMSQKPPRKETATFIIEEVKKVTF